MVLKKLCTVVWSSSFWKTFLLSLRKYLWSGKFCAKNKRWRQQKTCRIPMQKSNFQTRRKSGKVLYKRITSCTSLYYFLANKFVI